MRHFAQVLVFDVLAKFALAGISIALIRFMPVPEYAAYTFAVSAASLAAQVISAGANRIYIVGFHRHALAGKVESLLGLQLLAVALIALVATPFAGVFNGLYPTVVVLSCAMVGSEFSKTYYQRELQFGRYSGVEVVRTAAQCLAVGALLLVYRDRIEAASVLWAQSVVLAMAFLAVLQPVLHWRKFTQITTAGRLARGLATGPYSLLFAYFSVVAVFSQVDVVMVRWLAGDRVLASYGAALRYYGLLSLALGAVHAVLLPAIQHTQSKADLDRIYSQHFRLVLVFVPFVLVAAVSAQWLMPLVDHGQYPDSVPSFQVLAVSAIVSFAFSPHVNLLVKLERFLYLVVLVMIALGVNVILLVLLVPRLGSVGAAAAMASAAACVTIPIYFESRRLRLRQT